METLPKGSLKEDQLENGYLPNPILKPWDYFPKHILLEWHTEEFNTEHIFVRLYDSKNFCVLDYTRYELIQNFDHLRKIMKLFIRELIANNVI